MRTIVSFHRLFLVILFVALTSGCEVKVTAPYDAAIVAHAEQVYQDVDAFFVRLRVAEPGDRDFAAFEQDYLAIESSLRALLFKNQAREKNEEIIRQSQNALEIWRQQRSYFDGKYQTERGFSDKLIELNLANMRDALLAVIRAEMSKK